MTGTTVLLVLGGGKVGIGVNRSVVVCNVGVTVVVIFGGGIVCKSSVGVAVTLLTGIPVSVTVGSTSGVGVSKIVTAVEVGVSKITTVGTGVLVISPGHGGCER